MNFTCRSVLRSASYAMLIVLAFACFYHLRILQYNEPIINLGQICAKKPNNDIFVETLMETMQKCAESEYKGNSECKESKIVVMFFFLLLS